MTRRLSLFFVTLITSWLLVEGVASMVAGRSLLAGGWAGSGLGPSSSAAPARTVSDEEVLEASRLSPGVWRHHVDPLVSYVVKPGRHVRATTPPFTVDSLGRRAPRSPESPAARTRVVVLGDSVAFGLQLADDEILAARLRELLEPLLPDEALPLEVMTVAAEGWTHANALRMFLDHAAAWRPHAVVYLPVENDIVDGFGVNESGYRRRAPDLSQADPMLNVAMEAFFSTRSVITSSIDPDELARQGEGFTGPLTFSADLGLESRRRYDANADSIVRLSEACERLRAELLVAVYAVEHTQLTYVHALMERLAERLPELAVCLLFERVHDEFALPDDPHPDAAGVRAMAHWIAADLVRRRMLPTREGARVPEADPLAETFRATPRSWDDHRARAAELRARDGAMLRTAVDLGTGEGLLQILGGLLPDGRMAPRLAATLRAGAPRVEVVLADMGGTSGLAPLTVRVRIDDRPVGELVVPPAKRAGSASGIFALPDGVHPGDVVVVSLEADDWRVQRIDERSTMVACRLVRIASR